MACCDFITVCAIAKISLNFAVMQPLTKSRTTKVRTLTFKAVTAGSKADTTTYKSYSRFLLTTHEQET